MAVIDSIKKYHKEFIRNNKLILKENLKAKGILLLEKLLTLLQVQMMRKGGNQLIR